MSKVLFISYMNWDSLMEMPALLKNGGCSVDLFCTENSWVLENESYNRAYITEQDPEIFSEKLFNYLKLYKNNYQWIIPGDDIIMRILNEKITDTNLFYKVMPLTKIENRDLLGSKKGLSELCTKYGIRTPKYMIYNDKISIDEIIDSVGFPMMVKLDKSEGGFGVYKCNDREELVATVAKISNRENMVFQQFINGYEVNTEILTRNGKLIVYNYSKTLRTIGEFGVSTQRVYEKNNDLEIDLKHISDSLGLNGFANVVFLYSETENIYYLIEADVRPNSWMYYGKFTGNDFAAGIKKINKGDLSLVENSSKKKETFVSLYKKDIYRCIVEKDYKEVVKWALNWNGRWKFVPGYDQKTLNSVNQYLIKTFNGFFKQKLQHEFKFNLGGLNHNPLRLAK